MLYKSFRWKVALWSCVISGVVLFVFGAGVALNVKEEYAQMVDYDAEAIAVAVLQGSHAGGYASDPFSRIMSFEKGSYRGSIYEDEEDVDYQEPNIRLLAIRDSDGTFSYKNNPYWKEEYEVKLEKNPILEIGAVGGAVDSARGDIFSLRDGERWEARRYSMNGRSVYLALNQHEHQDEYIEIIQHMGLALPFALLVIAVGGWWVGVFAVKPVRHISRVVASIKPGELETRITEADREDEIGELSRLINDMLDRIEQGYEQAKRFTADASHELRTPLAILQAQLESKMRESEESMKSCSPMIEEVRRLKSLTHSLLFLSKADSGILEIDQDPVDLVSLTMQVLEDLRELPEAKGLSFEFDQDENVDPVVGDPLLVQQVLMNLIRNAMKYNHEGGRVSCQVTSNLTHVKALIGNNCDGINEEDRLKMFQRFYRGSKNRNRKSGGFGLGLNIAQTIAKAHGGNVALLSGENDWVEFEFVLPRNSPAKAV